MLRQAIAMSLEQEGAQEDEDKEELLKMALAMSLEEKDVEAGAGTLIVSQPYFSSLP